jgi:hypothetical protein
MGIKRGWPKLLVNMTSSAGAYRVYGEDEKLLFESNSDFTNAQPVDQENASFVAIRKMLTMPLVLRKPSGDYKVCDFDLHFESATLLSLSTNLRINERFMPGLKPVRETVGGLNQRDYGTFFMKTRFTNRKLAY